MLSYVSSCARRGNPLRSLVAMVMFSTLEKCRVEGNSHFTAFLGRVVYGAHRIFTDECIFCSLIPKTQINIIKN